MMIGFTGTLYVVDISASPTNKSSSSTGISTSGAKDANASSSEENSDS